eukprot:jgi/Mesen1/5944/ME000301S05072
MAQEGSPQGSNGAADGLSKADGSPVVQSGEGVPPSQILNNEIEKEPFIPPTPIREDQVENAVKFLSHPKVKGSPVKYRRSFLERKGLTADEIDEAFRRVPAPPAPPMAQPLGWGRLVLAAVLLSSAGAGSAIIAQKYAVPGFKAWLRKFVLGSSETEVGGKEAKASPAEEAAAAASAAAQVAATAVQSLTSAHEKDHKALEDMRDAVSAMMAVLKASEAARTAAPAATPASDAITMADLRKELRSFASVLSDFSPPPQSAPGGDDPAARDKLGSELAEIKQLLTRFADGRRSASQGAAPPSPPPPSVPQLNFAPTAAPVVAAPKEDDTDWRSLLKGSKASPGMPGSAPQLTAQHATRAAAAPPAEAPHSASYMQAGVSVWREVLEMLEKGQKPPGIRDIDDKPPNPTQAPSDSRMAPRPKPWERQHEAEAAAAGPPVMAATSSQSAGVAEAAAPWWRKPTFPVASQPPPLGRPLSPPGAAAIVPVSNASASNVVITELPSGSTPAGVAGESGSSRNVDVQAHGHSSSQTADEGIVSESSTSGEAAKVEETASGWVPPPIPTAAMPAAVAAIRHRPTHSSESSLYTSATESEERPHTQEETSSADKPLAADAAPSPEQHVVNAEENGRNGSPAVNGIGGDAEKPLSYSEVLAMPSDEAEA